MSYPSSVQYLYSLGNELKAGAKFGLERMQILLDALRNPHRGRRFIHVAGTNGKGSTCAMIAGALQQAGFRTGLYTSPHLMEPSERIQIDGQQVSAAVFSGAFDEVHAVAEQLLRESRIDAHPSYFETVTAMAFLIFRDTCEISVIEVGLGGRLDATNVITPELCVITPIAYDHEAYLGNTLAAIAGEKAGILKAGVPVVLAGQPLEAEPVIKARARALNCTVIRAEDHPLSIGEVSARDSRFELEGQTYRCNLAGRHQVVNAQLAVLACRQFGVPVGAVRAGLDATIWPGRLEFVGAQPAFVLDGAHNPAGAAALAAYIREFFSRRPVWLVYGAMRDKAIDEVTGQLFPLAAKLIVTAPNFPRALRPQAILEVQGHCNAMVCETVREAIDIARTAPQEAVVFFSGSLFLVGEVKEILRRAVSDRRY